MIFRTNYGLTGNKYYRLKEESNMFFFFIYYLKHVRFNSESSALLSEPRVYPHHDTREEPCYFYKVVFSVVLIGANYVYEGPNTLFFCKNLHTALIDSYVLCKG